MSIEMLEQIRRGIAVLYLIIASAIASLAFAPYAEAAFGMAVSPNDVTEDGDNRAAEGKRAMEEVVSAAGALFDGSKKFEVRISESLTLHIDGRAMSQSSAEAIWTVQTHNLWKLVPLKWEGARGEPPRIIADGDRGTIAIESAARYARFEVEGIGLLRQLRFGTAGQSRMAAILAAIAPQEQRLGTVRDLICIGTMSEQGQSAYLFTFRLVQPTGEELRESILLWVRARPPHVPLRIATIEPPSVVRRDGQEQTRLLSREMNFIFSDWRFGEEFARDQFQFEPSPEMQLMQHPSDVRFGPPPPDEVARPVDLTGQPAPNVSLRRLDGSQTALHELKENILIIDFWATWCLPCISAMPILMDVAGQYAEQGVALLAVNVGEQEATVREFLSARRWQLPVVLDADSAVADSFSVTGLPTTVVVGTDGLIHWMHVGFASDLEQQLKRVLDGLLQGTP